MSTPIATTVTLLWLVQSPVAARPSCSVCTHAVPETASSPLHTVEAPPPFIAVDYQPYLPARSELETVQRIPGVQALSVVGSQRQEQAVTTQPTWSFGHRARGAMVRQRPIQSTLYTEGRARVASSLPSPLEHL